MGSGTRGNLRRLHCWLLLNFHSADSSVSFIIRFSALSWRLRLRIQATNIAVLTLRLSMVSNLNKQLSPLNQIYFKKSKDRLSLF